MFDADLAKLYGVTTKALNQAVKRNISRFPDDFMFQMTAEEAAALRSQIVTSKGRGGSVLHSARAIQINIAIMRAILRLREMISSNKVLTRCLAELSKKYDTQFRAVFEAIHELMEEPEPKSSRIGFKT